jgi:hypothetical protein
MSLQRLSIDRVTLPQALLSLTKLQLRVDYDSEDELIIHKLAHAINLFENISGFGVSKAVWTWTPGPVSDAILVPVMRVSAFTAKDGVTDISANYTLSGDIHPEAISEQYFSGPSGSTVAPTVSLTTGFATSADLPPSITDVVMRIAAYLFEWREVQNVPGVDGVPYANSLLTNWWVPRA